MIAAAPAAAWDCHTHVFGAAGRHPVRTPSVYALPDAPLARHRAAAEAAGLTHAVLVQPAPFAQDPAAMLEALDASEGRLRGVFSARRDVDDAALERLGRAGVRALRFLEARTPAGERYAGSVELAELPVLAHRLKALGWHAEIWSELDSLLESWSALEGMGLPLVLDHMGGFDARAGVGDAAFQRLLALVREGAVWVKLTLCRRAPFGSDFQELRPFHDALVEANPARLLWGSDWPFVRMGEQAPTIPRLLELFFNWVDDTTLRRRILVDNPAALYA